MAGVGGQTGGEIKSRLMTTRRRALTNTGWYPLNPLSLHQLRMYGQRSLEGSPIP